MALCPTTPRCRGACLGGGVIDGSGHAHAGAGHACCWKSSQKRCKFGMVERAGEFPLPHGNGREAPRLAAWGDGAGCWGLGVAPWLEEGPGRGKFFFCQ